MNKTYAGGNMIKIIHNHSIQTIFFNDYNYPFYMHRVAAPQTQLPGFYSSPSPHSAFRILIEYVNWGQSKVKYESKRPAA